MNFVFKNIITLGKLNKKVKSEKNPSVGFEPCISGLTEIKPNLLLYSYFPWIILRWRHSLGQEYLKERNLENS